MRLQDLLRRAAGVAERVGQGSPGRHLGRWLCLNCPSDRHDPPFLPFALPIHVREHRERYPDHALAWWCWDHLVVEEVHTSGWRWVHDPVMSDGFRPDAGLLDLPVWVSPDASQEEMTT